VSPWWHTRKSVASRDLAMKRDVKISNFSYQMLLVLGFVLGEKFSFFVDLFYKLKPKHFSFIPQGPRQQRSCLLSMFVHSMGLCVKILLVFFIWTKKMKFVFISSFYCLSGNFIELPGKKRFDFMLKQKLNHLVSTLG
jgi:hypothetical protein